MIPDGPPLIVLAIHSLLAERTTSVEELATATGCSEAELAGLLSGASPLHTADIRRIAEALGTTPAGLMTRALALNPATAPVPTPGPEAALPPSGGPARDGEPDPEPPQVA